MPIHVIAPKNKKRVNLLICALIVGLLFVSTYAFSLLSVFQTIEAQTGVIYKKYENPKFGLSLAYDPSWVFKEFRKDPSVPSNDSIVVIFRSPPQSFDDKYLENIIINIQGPRSDIRSLETYTQNSLRAFNTMSETIQILKSGAATLSGLPAQTIEYTSTGIQGLSLKKFQIFTVVNNNTAYVVTFEAEDSEYPKYIKNIDKFIDSIHIDQSALKKVGLTE